MKKSKKFILSIVVILVIAVAILLSFPDLFDSGEKIDTDVEETEIQTELGEEIFD